MTIRVVLTRRAESELEGAADWWAAYRSPSQAARWYAGFSDALASLSQKPERCPFAPENGRFPYEIRELYYGLGSRPTHRAVFTIRREMVLVLTIRHAAQTDLREEDLP
jgi:plasmid stabilization system protein ParE